MVLLTRVSQSRLMVESPFHPSVKKGGEPLIAIPQSMAVHDFLDGWLGAVFAFQFQELFNMTASFLRVLSNEFQDAICYFRRCSLRVCFVDGRHLNSSKSCFLKRLRNWVGEMSLSRQTRLTLPSSSASLSASRRWCMMLVSAFIFFLLIDFLSSGKKINSTYHILLLLV